MAKRKTVRRSTVGGILKAHLFTSPSRRAIRSKRSTVAGDGDADSGSSAQSSLPSHDELDARFELALKEELSPCMWIPPKWINLQGGETEKKFSDNSRDAGNFAAKSDDRVKVGTDIQDVQGSEALPTDDTWPSPFADTSHIDATEFTKDEFDLIKNKLFEGNTKDRDALNKLDKIVGPDAPGMKRLERIFEWAVYRTCDLMKDLNLGLSNPDVYTIARDNYINFLRDLDNHEPGKFPRLVKGKKPTKLDPTKKESPSGYGRSIKWTCIEPVIFQGKIVGTRIVVKWNPHISSSGIAINH